MLELPGCEGEAQHLGLWGLGEHLWEALQEVFGPG